MDTPGFSRSQTRAVLSALTLASRCPSVENATAAIAPWCPLSVCSATAFRVIFCTSPHTLMVPSLSAVTSFAPSPEKAIAEIGDAWAELTNAVGRPVVVSNTDQCAGQH